MSFVKMNKIILILTLFSSLLLFLTPSIPAIEFHTINESINSLVQEEFNLEDDMIIDDIISSLKNGITKDNIQTLINQFSQKGKTLITSLINNIETEETTPYIDSILDLIVVIIVAIILSKIISSVFDQVSSVMMNAISTIISIFLFLLDIIAKTITFSVDTAIVIIGIILKFILNVGELGLYLLLGIVSLVVLIVVIIIYGIGIAVMGVWKIIGTVFGIILDIFRILYESIFSITT